MRIAYISTYPPIECGIGTYTSYLNEEIKKHDNETFIISQIGAQGKNVFPIFRAQSVSIGDQVFKITAKITPDLVHIQHEYGLYGPQKGVQIVGLILRYRLVDVPVVITLHTVSPKLRHYEEIILQSIVNGCSAIIVHEGRQKETLVKYFGQAKKIHVIPHGVREISPVKDAKKKLEVEGKKVILLCGYFRPTKGFHKIVEIFPKVCEKVDNAVLMIAGKSRGLEYKDYQKEFFEAINSSSVNDKILVLRGQFPQKTFDTIISASDVVALPYEIGGQSGVMAHCYAFSKPVVTSALPAFKK
ncbi:MAG: glycosyltransferase, partial [Candidatus Omnitrophica bacterium]|nr:glycosyltransferase [Candidatus Omnitrophota bacterium]